MTLITLTKYSVNKWTNLTRLSRILYNSYVVKYCRCLNIFYNIIIDTLSASSIFLRLCVPRFQKGKETFVQIVTIDTLKVITIPKLYCFFTFKHFLFSLYSLLLKIYSFYHKHQINNCVIICRSAWSSFMKSVFLFQKSWVSIHLYSNF